MLPVGFRLPAQPRGAFARGVHRWLLANPLLLDSLPPSRSAPRSNQSGRIRTQASVGIHRRDIARSPLGHLSPPTTGEGGRHTPDLFPQQLR